MAHDTKPLFVTLWSRSSRLVLAVSISSSRRAVPQAAQLGEGSPGEMAFSRRFAFGLVTFFRMKVACSMGHTVEWCASGGSLSSAHSSQGDGASTSVPQGRAYWVQAEEQSTASTSTHLGAVRLSSKDLHGLDNNEATHYGIRCCNGVYDVARHSLQSMTTYSAASTIKCCCGDNMMRWLTKRTGP